MKRAEALEQQFKKRYNRDVEVLRESHRNEHKRLTNCEVIILYKKDNEYRIDEYFTEDEKTNYVLVTINGKQHKFFRYLEGEVSIADAIGELEWQL